jgi:hypothetical protein
MSAGAANDPRFDGALSSNASPKAQSVESIDRRETLSTIAPLRGERRHPNISGNDLKQLPTRVGVNHLLGRNPGFIGAFEPILSGV